MDKSIAIRKEVSTIFNQNILQEYEQGKKALSNEGKQRETVIQAYP